MDGAARSDKSTRRPPTRQGSLLRHWAPSSVRLDQSAEPLIGPNSVVGFWPLQHWQAVPWHDHDFYEMAFIVQGSGLHFAGDREVRVGPGSVIFVPPGTAHGYRAMKDVAVYNCFFRAQLAEFELLWAARDSGLTRLFGNAGGTFRPPDAHTVVRLDPSDFDGCIVELDAIRNSPSSDRSHALEIGHLLLALDIVARRGRQEMSVTPAPQSQASRVVSTALELIETDLARPWTLSDLSAEVFVTTFYLAHQFRQWVGIPPIAYLSRRRAQHAAFLLAGTDDAIAAIGRAVGLADPATFSHQFHRVYGVSPREYRKRARAGSHDLPRV